MKHDYKHAKVLHKVCLDLYDVDISSSTRKGSLIRFIASKILREHCGYKTTQIGTFMNRDHSTIIHHVNSINGWLTYDESAKRKYNKILQEFVLCTPVPAACMSADVLDATIEALGTANDMSVAALRERMDVVKELHSSILDMLIDVVDLLPADSDIYAGLGDERDDLPVEYYKGALAYRKLAVGKIEAYYERWKKNNESRLAQDGAH